MTEHLRMTASCVYLWILKRFSNHFFYRAHLGKYLFHVQVAEFQPPDTVKKSFTSAFHGFALVPPRIFMRPSIVSFLRIVFDLLGIDSPDGFIFLFFSKHAKMERTDFPFSIRIAWKACSVSEYNFYGLFSFISY